MEGILIIIAIIAAMAVKYLISYLARIFINLPFPCQGFLTPLGKRVKLCLKNAYHFEREGKL